MSTEDYLVHKGYRARLERGTWVWTKIMPKKYVGKHPDTGKPIKIALSGDNSVAKKRVVTSTSDYEEAVKMLDRFLKPAPKEPKFKVPKEQQKLF